MNLLWLTLVGVVGIICAADGMMRDPDGNRYLELIVVGLLMFVIALVAIVFRWY